VASDGLTLAFGKVLRKLRKAQGLSQEELAHQARTGQPYISLLEAGHHSPSLLTMGLLAAAFRMTVSDLVRRAEREVDRPDRGRRSAR